MGLGRIQSATDYEDLRNARILENQNRLKTLGLRKTMSELRSLVTTEKSPKATPARKWTKKVYETSSLRRSSRLKNITSVDYGTSRRQSHRLRAKLFAPVSGKDDDDTVDEGSPWIVGEERVRPGNMPLVKIKGLEAQLSPEALARRCDRNGRGSVYDSVFGICCHFCRQKTLCSEEECKRCGNLDGDEPCIGKTDCSACHSSQGVLCRACLKIRYGEELEDVMADKDWMCPHCVEEKGTKAFWMCNSSICLKKRKISPTGIAIYRAQALGYKSVAHLLMDELKGAFKRKLC